MQSQSNGQEMYRDKLPIEVAYSQADPLPVYLLTLVHGTGRTETH